MSCALSSHFSPAPPVPCSEQRAGAPAGLTSHLRPMIKPHHIQGPIKMFRFILTSEEKYWFVFTTVIKYNFIFYERKDHKANANEAGPW